MYSTNKQEPVSLLNTPYTFLEYRVRVYGKKQESVNKEGYVSIVSCAIIIWSHNNIRIVMN